MGTARATMERADILVTKAGLAESRERARRLIEAGVVLANGFPVARPASRLPRSAHLTLRSDEPDYASRAALKLLGALAAFPELTAALDGCLALDLGSSTGGFVDVLLRWGAARILAVDVGRGQLLSRLAQDARVLVCDRTNARTLDAATLAQWTDQAPTLLTADLSFIALRRVLPAVLPLMGPTATAVLLVKPQFELTLEEGGGQHVVRDQALRERAAALVETALVEAGWVVHGRADSPLPGPKGNLEWLVWAQRGAP